MPHHAHSIDRWDDATGSTLYEHLAGVKDLLLARATFAAASTASSAHAVCRGAIADGRVRIL
jgi:hypothetical protein